MSSSEPLSTPEYRPQGEQFLALVVLLGTLVLVLVVVFVICRRCRAKAYHRLFCTLSPEEENALPSCRNFLKVERWRVKSSSPERSPLLDDNNSQMESHGSESTKRMKGDSSSNKTHDSKHNSNDELLPPRICPVHGNSASSLEMSEASSFGSSPSWVIVTKRKDAEGGVQDGSDYTMDSEDSDIVKADPSTESARLEFQQQAASGVDSNPRNSSLSARESTHNHKSDDWDQKRHPIDDRDDSHMLERSHNQRSQLENMENRSTQTSQVEAKKNEIHSRYNFRDSRVATSTVAGDFVRSKPGGSTDSQSSRRPPTNICTYASTDDHSAQASQGKAKDKPRLGCISRSSLLYPTGANSSTVTGDSGRSGSAYGQSVMHRPPIKINTHSNSSPQSSDWWQGRDKIPNSETVSPHADRSSSWQSHESSTSQERRTEDLGSDSAVHSSRAGRVAQQHTGRNVTDEKEHALQDKSRYQNVDQSKRATTANEECHRSPYLSRSRQHNQPPTRPPDEAVKPLQDYPYVPDQHCTSDQVRESETCIRNKSVDSQSTNVEQVSEPHIPLSTYQLPPGFRGPAPTTESRIVGYSMQGSDPSHSSTFVPTAPSVTDTTSHNKQQKTKVNATEPDGVSDLFIINDYAACEWKGTTSKAVKMLKGYKMIPVFIRCTQLRRIRGDNYCAIRASMFQAFVTRLPVLEHFASEDLKKVPRRLYEGGCHWLCNWSFANRMANLQREEVIDHLEQCLDVLSLRASHVNTFRDGEKCLRYVLREFNGDRKIDFAIMEAMKLLMLEQAVSLYRRMQRGEDVPVWVFILFARDTSPDPQTLVRNHFNNVGDTGGLEQIEMFLLGHTLKATLQVFRPSQVDAEDFVSRYPDDLGEHSPVLPLIAEDDRHYNIIATNIYSIV